MEKCSCFNVSQKKQDTKTCVQYELKNGWKGWGEIYSYSKMFKKMTGSKYKKD